MLDSTEAQLRFGSALTETTDSSHPSHPLNPNFGRANRETRSTRDELAQAAMFVDSRRRGRLPTSEKINFSLKLLPIKYTENPIRITKWQKKIYRVLL